MIVLLHFSIHNCWFLIVVDGGWTEWSIMSDSDCSKPCGGGEQTKVRTCTNPKPQNGGKECEGADKVTVKCNDESCDGKFWLDFGKLFWLEFILI